ncbi:hypothetical protein [Hyphobacterium sp.]|uniref:hypothetical protein n=1 Tax=Hyphobacterium sp. TaxID=2004662 RepID=UPI003B527EE8
MIMNFLVALGAFFLLFVAFIAIAAAGMRPFRDTRSRHPRPDGARQNPGSSDPVAPN